MSAQHTDLEADSESEAQLGNHVTRRDRGARWKTSHRPTEAQSLDSFFQASDRPSLRLTEAPSGDPSARRQVRDSG